MSVENLNNEFSLSSEKSSLRFKTGKSGIPVVEIKNTLASAVISLQGAHVLSWKPIDNDEVIWLSDEAKYILGKPVRGGIPICWPWFGAHESNPSFPAHGFARNVLWEVIDTTTIASGETEITFRLSTDELDEKFKNIWPLSTAVEYKVSVGKQLNIELSTFNKSDQTMTITQALHTYFNIDDIGNTKVYGLDGKTYLDKTEGFASKIQDGPITIDSEVDRVYLDTKDDITIDDTIRKVIIKKQGSRSTVVWNPWKDIAKKMDDLDDEGYRKMLCVESANVADDIVNIKPNESYSLVVSYNIQEKNR